MLIRKMEKNVSDFVANPKKDFTRKSELSFSKTMRFILGMGSRTLGKELLDFYEFDSKMVSVSAIVQRRSKILPSAFKHLFHEFNNEFKDILKKNGLKISGTSPDGLLAEIVENPKWDWFVGCQFHPEFKSRPNAPHPLFLGLINTAIKNINQP